MKFINKIINIRLHKACVPILAARPQPVSPDVLKKFLLDQLYSIFHDKQALGLLKNRNRLKISKEDYSEWFTREELEDNLTIKSNTVIWKHFIGGVEPTEFYRFICRQITKRVFSRLHNYGWYVLRKNLIPKPVHNIYFLLEPYYGEPVLDVPKYLYHTTHVTNKERILRKGLIPQQIGKLSKHQNRVYVALTEEAGYDFLNIMRLHGISQEEAYYEGQSNPQVLLKIDTSKLRPGTKFYYDVEVADKRAAWTYTHIPAKAISVVLEDKPDHDQ